MKSKNRLINLIIILISISFGLILCEFLGKKIGLGDPVLYNEDDIVGYRLQPKQKKIRRGSKISTDLNISFSSLYISITFVFLKR